MKSICDDEEMGYPRFLDGLFHGLSWNTLFKSMIWRVPLFEETSISVCLKIVYPDICYFNEKNDDLHMDLGLAYFPTSPYKKENGRRISMERQHLR